MDFAAENLIVVCTQNYRGTMKNLMFNLIHKIVHLCMLVLKKIEKVYRASGIPPKILLNPD